VPSLWPPTSLRNEIFNYEVLRAITLALFIKIHNHGGHRLKHLKNALKFNELVPIHTIKVAVFANYFHDISLSQTIRTVVKRV
jgi:hypothetical protein